MLELFEFMLPPPAHPPNPKKEDIFYHHAPEWYVIPSATTKYRKVVKEVSIRSPDT